MRRKFRYRGQTISGFTKGEIYEVIEYIKHDNPSFDKLIVINNKGLPEICNVGINNIFFIDVINEHRNKVIDEILL